ncbi:CNP1-like family protein [Thiobacillus sedimenti]|uniref:CNP1-like family protein n=1 Tax=Thiobacillus sedimenti TaxID=3110231 RepID=A0ABZ1CI01_9PROT|nr:CNP1-like family protein [Thiobacillus sp. SCUT-2]WRS37917.1 CNP1-like family protein [Thiobacillus sp. SCUT-2]
MRLLPALLLCLPLAAHAAWIDIEHDFSDDKPWSEVAAKLPPYPKDANLLPFNVSSATSNRFFVDADSISVGADQVVRYTVVVKAAGGATNVSYEGIRCETGERRLYAYGHPDGTWSKARNAGWEPIRMRSLLSYRKALYEDHFCPGGITVRDAKQAVNSLRRGAR